MASKAPPGFLCRLGQSDLIGGTARGIIIALSVLGPLTGGILLWGVQNLSDKLDKIDQHIGTLFERTSTLEKDAGIAASVSNGHATRLDRLEEDDRDHEHRITHLEAVKP